MANRSCGSAKQSSLLQFSKALIPNSMTQAEHRCAPLQQVPEAAAVSVPHVQANPVSMEQRKQRKQKQKQEHEKRVPKH